MFICKRCSSLSFSLTQGHNGQKKYQVNLRSHSAPIQVMLINRETSCSKPVVVSVPPLDDISAMPTPPSTPAGLQRFPISSADLCDLKRGPLKSPAAEHQLTPSSTSPDIHMGTAFILAPFLAVHQSLFPLHIKKG